MSTNPTISLTKKLGIKDITLTITDISIHPNWLDALKDLNNLIFFFLLFTKILDIVIVDTMAFVNTAIKIIELVFAPAHIIIIGPRATLGSEFSIVKKGSKISLINLL